MRSPALISACSKAGYHAVLASLSGRYPPLEGRSPTCYSPVCHSTHGLLHFRVRLACIRHAASVDSEPGSNSHVKLVALHVAAFAITLGDNSFNASYDLLCVVQSVLVISWFAANARSRTVNLVEKNAVPRADSHCPTGFKAQLLRAGLLTPPRRAVLCVLARTI